MELALEKKEKEYKEASHIGQSDQIEIGQWYWVKDVEEDGDRVLCCIDEIGSNYIHFESHGVEIPKDIEYDPRDSHYSFRLHMDEFEQRCQYEGDPETYFDERLKSIQQKIKQKTLFLAREGERLYLMKGYNKVDSEYDGSLLPSVIMKDPIQYHKELVKFDQKVLPKIQREIKALAIDFVMTSKNMSLSEVSKLEFTTSQLRKIEDRIFAIELYAGIHEKVHQITDGDAGDINEPISIRQQLLFMDEECLIDFDKGGMDFEKLEDFDRWVAKPENLVRVLPEQKGIVAFRVRRDEKKYAIPTSLWEFFVLNAKYMENMKTYLLIRNGQKVYRIASAIDFSPRLIPFKDEIGEKQFKKMTRNYNWEKKGYDEKVEEITPDHIKYDDHVREVEMLVRKYNRIFVFIQGLLDRSDVFSPHPAIRLNRQNDMDLWINCIRDEELGLPNNSITFEEYRDQLNKTLKKGDSVYSTWISQDLGRYSYKSNNRYYNAWESQIVSRPNVCKVESIKRDKSEVQIVWETDTNSWDYHVKEKINRHLWIPMKEVFNISDYNQGDYMMFLCDRTLQGKYLEWAPALLTAEKIKITPVLKRRKGV